jgi:hypothetical protein
MSPPPLVLDTGPLAQLVHPRLDPDLAHWFKAAIAAGLNLVVPEIADDESRRNGAWPAVWFAPTTASVGQTRGGRLSVAPAPRRVRGFFGRRSP